MMEVEQEHRRGANLRKSEIDWLISRGVPKIALAKTPGCAPGEYYFILSDRVVFLPAGYFEFARNLRQTDETVQGYTMVLRDVDGFIADILAWDPTSGRTGLWRKAVSMLGEEQV